MTQASTTRRARLDALLDQGGLEQASAADRAWLTAERARDAGFDREVAALLRAEAHLREWGGQHTVAGQGPDEALAGIFAGLDAGLFDDGLELDGAPQFADGEGDGVGLAARAAASPVTGNTSPLRLVSSRVKRSSSAAGEVSSCSVTGR